eukprot:1048841-Karenia_brevis.AAC.1
MRDGFDYSPAFWDSPPIVCTLYKALVGRFSGCGHIDGFSNICKNIFEEGGVAYPTCGPESDARPDSSFLKAPLPFKFQKQVYKVIQQHLLPASLVDILRGKLSKLIVKSSEKRYNVFDDGCEGVVLGEG